MFKRVTVRVLLTLFFVFVLLLIPFLAGALSTRPYNCRFIPAKAPYRDTWGITRVMVCGGPQTGYIMYVDPFDFEPRTDYYEYGMVEIELKGIR